MTPAPDAAPTPASPVEDGQKVWLNADRIFLAVLAIFFPLAMASHFFFPGTNDMQCMDGKWLTGNGGMP